MTDYIRRHLDFTGGKDRIAMKIKTRLGIAFLTITLVPMFLIYLAFSVLTNYQIRAFRESHGLTEPVDLLSGNTIQIFNRLTQSNQKAIQEKLEKDPDSFADPNYLDSINQELNAKYAYLIVRRGDQFIYSGITQENSDIYRHLSNYDESDTFGRGDLPGRRDAASDQAAGF